MTATDIGNRILWTLELYTDSLDENGDPRPAGWLVAADGAGNNEYIDPATIVTGGATALDDLTDVTITTPAAADRLRYDGAVWANSALTWKNVMVLDPTSGNYLPVTTGGGDAVYTEAI